MHKLGIFRLKEGFSALQLPINWELVKMLRCRSDVVELTGIGNNSTGKTAFHLKMNSIC